MTVDDDGNVVEVQAFVKSLRGTPNEVRDVMLTYARETGLGRVTAYWTAPEPIRDRIVMLQCNPERVRRAALAMPLEVDDLGLTLQRGGVLDER